MKILLLIAKDGYSFVNQSTALALGLKKIGIDSRLTRITDVYPEKEIREYDPDVVIGVGSWHQYHEFIRKPQELGYKTIPWIVSDGLMATYLAEYNELPLILTTSEHCKDTFVQLGFRSDIIHVIYEAVDDSFWKPLSEEEVRDFARMISIQEPSLKELHLTFDIERLKADGVPIIFTTGGSPTGKGAQEVISALGRLDRSIPWIYMLKSWPSTDSFKYSIDELNLAGNLGISDRIRYISGEFSKEFIRGLINCSDIYAAPSRGEGFGLPLVEAQMCGKPVVTLDATSTRELVSHGKTGFIAKRDAALLDTRADVADLAVCFEKLLTNRTLISEMGKNAYTESRARFNPESIARAFLAEIKSQI